ncbi:alpha/beta fold hydrolase [Cellulomonas hominis]
MAVAHDLTLADGRTLRAYDCGTPAADAELTVLWHHGSPQTGAPIAPVLAAATERGVRLLTYARPGYGGSTVQPGRDVASAAGDVEQLLDALGVGQLAVLGASGGGPHALACAALLPGRVTAAVCLAAIAPVTRDIDWYAGMHSPGGLRAAAAGRAARADFAATDEFDPASFTAADWSALSGDWAALGIDAERAGAAGPDGLVDDDVAFASPWGFDPADITVPVLLVQGDEDRVIPPAHAAWLAGRVPRGELWVRPGDGHVSVLAAVPAALDWLLALEG